MGTPPLLVRLVKDWHGNEFARQTPKQSWAWDGIQFTRDSVEECDYLVMLDNRTPTDTVVRCPRQNVWAFLQEPYVPGLHDWMVEGHEPYAKVLTHHPPSADPKYTRAQPAAQWLVERSFDDLVSMDAPAKTEGVSWVTSTLSYFPGHKKRHAFLSFLRNRGAPVELFGRGIRPLADKWDALAPYRYSLAVENTSSPDYWTEKLADCFLAWTVPIYYGCPNLEDYFPADSFIRIDVERPAEAVATIEWAMASDRWAKRRAAVQTARDLVLHRYQLFPYLSAFLRVHAAQTSARTAEKVPLRIPGYRRRRYIHRARFLKSRLREGDISDVCKGLLARFKRGR